VDRARAASKALHQLGHVVVYVHIVARLFVLFVVDLVVVFISVRRRPPASSSLSSASSACVVVRCVVVRCVVRRPKQFSRQN